MDTALVNLDDYRAAHEILADRTTRRRDTETDGTFIGGVTGHVWGARAEVDHA